MVELKGAGIALVLLVLSCLAAPSAAADEATRSYPPVLTPQFGHGQPVTCAAISPNGLYAATGSEDHTIGLWEVATGARVRTLTGHLAKVSTVAFSPDGSRLVSGAADGTARIWDLLSGKEVAQFAHRASNVSAVAFSQSGANVCTGSAGGILALWRVADGQSLGEFQGHDDAITAIALSPTGGRIATASADGTARIWSKRDWQRPLVLRGKEGGLSSVAFSADGRGVVTGTPEGGVRLWEAASGTLVREVAAPQVPVENGPTLRSTACFSHDGKHVLAGRDGAIYAWPVDGGAKPLPAYAPGGWDSSVSFAVAVSRDRKTVLCWSDRQVASFDASRGFGQGQVHARGCTSPVEDASERLALSGDARRLLVRMRGDWSDRSVLWDLEHGRPIRRFDGGALAISASGRFGLLARNEIEGTVACPVNLDTGATLWTLAGHGASIVAGALGPQGSLAATGDTDGTVILWDMGTGAEVRRFDGHHDTVWSLAFSPDGRRLLTGSADGSARLWSVDESESVRTLQDGLIAVYEVAFHPDGDRVFLGSATGTLRACSAETGRVLWEQGDERGGITCMAVFADGRRMLTTHFGNGARIRSTKNGRILHDLAAQPSVPRGAVCSSDGRWVITATDEGTARVFEAASGELQCSFRAGLYLGWTIWDPAGRFDTAAYTDHSEAYALDRKLSWTYGLESVPLEEDSLWRRCYEPNLLARHLSTDERRFHTQPKLEVVRRPPALTVSVEDERRLKIHLRDLGGGLGPVVVRVDGVEVARHPAGAGHEDRDTERTIVEDLAADDGSDESKLRVVEVFAYDVGSTVSARWTRVVGTTGTTRAGRESGRPRLIPGHPALSEVPETSADGRWGVTSDPMCGPARIWDCETGTVIRRLGNGCPCAEAAAISPDGRWAAVQERGAAVKVLDWRTRDVRFEHMPTAEAGGLMLLDAPLRLLWVEQDDADAGGASREPAQAVIYVARLDDEGRAVGEPRRYPLTRGHSCLDASTSTAGAIRVLVLTQSNEFQVRELASGRIVRRWANAVPRTALDAALSGLWTDSDSKARIRGDVVTVSLPHFAAAWRVSTGALLHSTGNDDGPWDPRQYRAATDGARLLAFSENEILVVSEADSGVELLRRTYGSAIQGLAFDAPGTRLYVSLGTRLERVQIPDGSTRRFGRAAPHRVSLMRAISPDSARRSAPRGSVTLVGTPHADKTDRPYLVVGLHEGRPVGSGSLAALHAPHVSAADQNPMIPRVYAEAPKPPLLSPDGGYAAYFVAEEGNLTVRSTDAAAATTLEDTQVTSCAFDPGGAYLVYARGGEVVTFDLVRKRVKGRVTIPDQLLGSIRRVTRGARYVLLASGGDGADVNGPERGVASPVLLDLESRRLADVPAQALAPDVWIRDVSIDGKALLVEKTDRSLVFDLSSGRLRCSVPVVGAELSGDGSILVSFVRPIYPELGMLLAFDATTGRPLARWDTDP